MKRESKFLTDMKRSWPGQEFFFKIPDMPHFQGAKFRFDIPKPFDVLATLDKTALGIETKAFSEFEAFSSGMMRASQVDALDRWTSQGQLGLVIIQIAIPKTPMVGIFSWKEWRGKLVGGLRKAQVLELPWHAQERKPVPYSDGSLYSEPGKKRPQKYAWFCPLSPIRALVDSHRRGGGAQSLSSAPPPSLL